MANFLTRLSQTALGNTSQVMPVVTFQEVDFSHLPLPQEFSAHDQSKQTDASTMNYSHALVEGENDNKQYEQEKKLVVTPHQDDKNKSNRNMNSYEMQTSPLRSVDLPFGEFSRAKNLKADRQSLKGEHHAKDKAKPINPNKVTIQSDISEAKVNKSVNHEEHNPDLFAQKKSLPNVDHSKNSLPLNDLNKEENKQKDYFQAQKTFSDDERKSIQQLKNNELGQGNQTNMQVAEATFEYHDKTLADAIPKSQFAEFENIIANEVEQKNDDTKKVSIQLDADKQIATSSINNNKLELLEKMQPSLQKDNSSHLSNNKQLSLPKIKITINRLHVRGLNKPNSINKKVVPRSPALSLKEYLNQSLRHGESAE